MAQSSTFLKKNSSVLYRFNGLYRIRYFSNDTSKLMESLRDAKSTLLQSSIAKTKEFFNDNQIEQIKHEFETELNALDQRQYIKMNASMDQIYSNIARITDRMNALNASHQTFHEVYNSALRELKAAPVWKQENNKEVSDNLKYLEEANREVNGDKKTTKGSYGLAKTLGMRLIDQYQNQITMCYQNQTEQVIGH